MTDEFKLSVGAKIDGTDIQKQIDSLPKKTVTVHATTKGLKEISTMVDKTGDLVTTTSMLDKEGKVLNTTLSKVKTSFVSASDSIQTATKHTATLGEKLLDVTKKVATFGGVTALIGLFTKGMYEAVEVVKEFDDAQTEFKKVSDLSGDSLDDYTRKLGELGKEVARTRTEMVEASTEFKRSSYSDEDSARLAKVASLFQNVADSELSAGDSASFIISQLKAFKLSASDAEGVIDKVNATSNAFAVSSTDISTALTKTSSAMSTLGNDINETIGLTVAGTEQLTGQASKVAKGLRSIGLNISKEANNMGSLSYEVGNTTKQISLLDETTGDMKNTFQVLKEINEDWDAMNYSQKTAIGTALAGKTQYEVFAAIQTQFADAIEASNVALNSQGSAMAENDKYMDSIKGKLGGLRAEFEDIVNGDGGLQSFAKTLLDSGTGILTFINDSDALNVALVATGLILGMNLIPKMVLFGSTLVTNLSSIIATTVETQSLSYALELAGVSASTAQIAFVGLTLALSAGVMAYNLYKKSQEEAIANAKEITDVYVSEQESMSNTLSKINDEKATREELISIVESLGGKYSDEEKSLADVNDLRKQSIDLLYEEAKAKAQETVRSTGSQYEKSKKSLSGDYSSGAWGMSLGTKAETLEIDTSAIDAYNKKIEDGIELNALEKRSLQALEEERNKLSQEISDATSIVTGYEEATNILNSTEEDWLKNTQEQNEAIEETSTEVEKSAEEISDAEQELESLAEALGVSTEKAEAMAKSLDLSNEELSKVLSNLGLSADELKNNSDVMGLSIKQYIEYASAMDDFNDSLDSIQSAYSTLSTAMDEYNESGNYSYDTVQALLALDGDYLSMLQVVNGQMTLNEDAIRNKVLAQVEEAKQTIYNTAIEKLNALANEEAGNSAKNSGTNADSGAEGWRTLSDATREATVNALAYKVASSDKDKASEADAIVKDLENQVAVLDSAVSGMGSNFAGSMGKATSATKKTKDATKDLESEVKKIKSSLESLLKEKIQDDIDDLKDAEEEEVSVLEKRINVLKKNKEAQTASIDKQISAIEKLKDAEEARVESKIKDLENEKDSVEDYYDAEIAKLEKANTELERNNKLMELQQALALAQSTKVMVMGEDGKYGYQQDEGAVVESEQNLDEYQQELAMQQQIESLQAMKDSAVANIDAQISKWEEYKTKMSENYQSQIDSLQEYKQSMQDGYDEEIEALEENIEAVQEDYEAKIEVLEEYKDNVNDFVDSLSESEQRQLENQLNTIKQTASNYETDLNNLKEYINKYNAMLSKKGKKGVTISTSTSIGSVAKHADGVSSVGQDEIALVDDDPNNRELVVGSRANGTLMNLAKGTGVVNNTGTEKFAGLLNLFGKSGSLNGSTGETINNSSSTSSNSTNLSINSLTIKANNPSEFESWARRYSSGMLQVAYSN